ncbi:colicin E3-like toxin immunity protein [Erwinia sp. S38]|nr:hypothetical protein [Erwinia sp. S38]
MGLKLHMKCFDLLTERCICKDYSDNLGNDGSVMEFINANVRIH